MKRLVVLLLLLLSSCAAPGAITFMPRGESKILVDAIVDRFEETLQDEFASHHDATSQLFGSVGSAAGLGVLYLMRKRVVKGLET